MKKINVLDNFISHSVQIKQIVFLRCIPRFLLLYIPLRSDKTGNCEKIFIEYGYFISHSVQIKRFWIVLQQLVQRLYIPLRSDKTTLYNQIPFKLCNFISHSVQIKPFFLMSFAQATCFFISHSVQIKQKMGYNGYRNVETLYIPLRSDKTKHRYSRLYQTFKLYIPLRSDKTAANSR